MFVYCCFCCCFVLFWVFFYRQHLLFLNNLLSFLKKKYGCYNFCLSIVVFLVVLFWFGFFFFFFVVFLPTALIISEPLDVMPWIFILVMCIQIVASTVFLFEWLSPFGYDGRNTPRGGKTILKIPRYDLSQLQLKVPRYQRLHWWCYQSTQYYVC